MHQRCPSLLSDLVVFGDSVVSLDTCHYREEGRDSKLDGVGGKMKGVVTQKAAEGEVNGCWRAWTSI